MKLYTEEQVKVLINALDDIRDWDDDLEVDYDDAGSRAVFALNNFSQLTPIELPSDEDILEECNKLPFEKHVDCGMYNDGQVDGFELGAKWMKEQILNQNK